LVQDVARKGLLVILIDHKADLEGIVIERRVNGSANFAARWGIVLSAGNGNRLREFIHQRSGDYLPKQYNTFIGSRSMLEHTCHRAERLIPPRRLFVVVAKEHLKFQEVRRQLSFRPPETTAVQPADRETAPGVLLPLIHIYKRDPDAIIAVFPSDHFILQESLFMRHVDRAFQLVESNRSRLVVLGIRPHEPESEYRYIVPGEKIDDSGIDAPREVALFVEKPAAEAVKKIIASGALWNTMVMVFTCKTFLSVIRGAAPELHRSFQQIPEAIGTPAERHRIERVYHELPSLNLSKGILEALPFEHRRNLVILPVRGVTWSDWGTSARLSRTLRHLGQPKDTTPSPAVSEANRASISDRLRGFNVEPSMRALEPFITPPPPSITAVNTEWKDDGRRN
jgi:mannose-1-phosphate guanylyltransferase